jgi:OOP family OmpA-OmpF porin
MTRMAAVFATLLLLGASNAASAQSIGFAGAIDRLASQCSKDINKFCKKVNLGGGRMMQCLDRNSTGVSAQCKASITAVQVLLTTRAEARKQIPRVCDADIRRFCAGVQPGDGNLMECFYKAKNNISAQCRSAVANAGYE